MKPSLPLSYTYTPYYCEENIYLLAETLSRDQSVNDRWETYVAILSNPTKSLALWSQKLSKASDSPVVWDYHCVLLLKARRGIATASEPCCWVFDYDSRLGMPCPVQDYIEATFGGLSFQLQLDEFQSWFRIVSAADYIDNFASDRSHMLVMDDDGNQTYCHPPPSYPCVVGRRVKEKNITNNLMDTFVSMSCSHTSSIQTESVGKVMSFEEFLGWIGNNTNIQVNGSWRLI